MGDAAGHYHPLTGVGMTLGFGDALALAENGDFRKFARGRFQATRAPELLAMGVYEAFGGRSGRGGVSQAGGLSGLEDRTGVPLPDDAPACL